MLVCENCKKELPDDSVYCPFCGTSITSNDNNQKKDTPERKKSNKKQKILIIVLATLLLFTIALGAYEYTYYNGLVAELNDILEQKSAELERQIEKVDKLDGRIEQIKKSNDLLMKAAKKSSDFDNLTGLLRVSTSNNSKISMDSYIYAVRKGKKETIKIKWKTYSTMYMNSSDSTVVNAEWSGDNVVITGKKVGVAALSFDTQSPISKKALKITVICYE